MLVHRLLIESVDRRRLGGCARGNDVPSERVDRRREAPGDKKLGPLGGKGARDSTTDRTSGSIDHGNLVFQHHLSDLLLGAPAHQSRGIAWLAAFGLQWIRRLGDVEFIAAWVCLKGNCELSCRRR